jgi:hypothetical protein
LLLTSERCLNGGFQAFVGGVSRHFAVNENGRQGGNACFVAFENIALNFVRETAESSALSNF